MPERITSHPSISPIDRPDSQPAQNRAAAPNRRPSRTLDAGLPHGAGSASALHKRTHSASASPLLRRTLSRSDLTDRVAAFSQRFQQDQESPHVARFTSPRECDAAERPTTQTSQAEHAEQPARADTHGDPSGTSGTAATTTATPPTATPNETTAAAPDQSTNDAHQPRSSFGSAHPYPVPHFGPHLAPAYTPYSYAPHAQPWGPPVTAPYYSPYHWSAQHVYPASGSAFTPHGYASYTQPLPWHAPLPGWLAPTYQSRVVGANSRIGFTYGFGDGPTGKQMHVGFHFNGRFRTLRFGLYPSATRPFFVQTHSGYTHAMPAPAWPPAAPWHGSPALHHGGAVNAHAGATAANRPWHAVLEIPRDRATVELVTLRCKLKKRRLEANAAGNRPALLELQAAYESALQALSARAAEEPVAAANRA